MQFAHNGYYKGSTPLGLNLLFTNFFFFSNYKKEAYNYKSN